MDELQQQVAEIKARPGERIEPLPEIKPYEAFAYNAASLRSPFVPSAPARSDVANARASGREASARIPRAVPARHACAWSARCNLQGRNYGLVQGKDGLVHRVLPGNFIGQNDGRIVGITPHQNFNHRDHPRRSRRIHRASSRAGVERMIPREKPENVVSQFRRCARDQLGMRCRLLRVAGSLAFGAGRAGAGRQSSGRHQALHHGRRQQGRADAAAERHRAARR